MKRETAIHTDLTVVGGGVAGICAAVAAARGGLSVALINDRSVLGGVASSELGIAITGAAGGSRGSSASVYAREGGPVEELKLKICAYGDTPDRVGTADPIRSAAFLDFVCGEPNIRLYLDTVVQDVDTAQGRIQAVHGVQLGSEARFRFDSPLFVDATGDGTVAALAGARFLYGREAADTFGESYAPPQADDCTMGDTLVFHTRRADRPIPYRRPDFAYDITTLPFFDNLRGQGCRRSIWRAGGEFHTIWWIECGGHDRHIIRDDPAIRFELYRLVYGLWDYIKNSGEFPDVDDLELTYVSPIAGKRESRRILGRYVLTQNDIRQKTVFPDAIAVGGWPMDVHAPHGIRDPGPPSRFYYVPGMYDIPLRCAIAADVDNLFLAGRDMSVSHIAFGSTRVMGTGGCVGQAVGTAAVLCREQDILPGELPDRADLIDRLRQRLLRDDQTIRGGREPFPFDPATVEITSSLCAPFSCLPSGEAAALDREYLLCLPIETPRLTSVELRLRNTASSPASLTYTVWTGNRPENYLADIHLADREIRIDGGYDGPVTLPIEADVGADGKLYLLLQPHPALYVYTAVYTPTGAITRQRLPGGQYFVDEHERHPYRADHQLYFTHVLPAQQPYRCASLINGYSRPYGTPNLWIGQKDAAGEAFIQFSFAQPVTVKTLALVFNTGLDTDQLDTLSPLVRAYRLTVTDADGREEIHEITNNIKRQVLHEISLDTVSQIRIRLLSNDGAPFYEVFAVKFYP